MLIASLLWYLKFRRDLESQGFKLNPYDPCVVNKTVNKKQHTIRFHVDNLKSSHIDPKVNDKFEKWLQVRYGKHGAVKPHRGNVHDYLGMIFDYTEKGKVKVDMKYYVKNMLKEFPVELKTTDTAMTPAADDLFDKGPNKPIKQDKKEVFHTTVAKGLFLSKRARPDLQPTVPFLCTRVKAPDTDDYKKLVRMLWYLNGTKKLKMVLKADNLTILKWYVDAEFAVHKDMKSHTGAMMTIGKGCMYGSSTRQKLNKKSSTEAELVAVDDVMAQILWTKYFLEAQGYKVDENNLFQDNKSAILLEKNGKASSGK